MFFASHEERIKVMSTILLSTELGVIVLLNEGGFIMSLLLGYSGDQKSHIILIKDKNMGLLVFTRDGEQKTRMFMKVLGIVRFHLLAIHQIFDCRDQSLYSEASKVSNIHYY